VNDAFDQDDLCVEMSLLRSKQPRRLDVSIRQARIDFAGMGRMSTSSSRRACRHPGERFDGVKQ